MRKDKIGTFLSPNAVGIRFLLPIKQHILGDASYKICFGVRRCLSSFR